MTAVTSQKALRGKQAMEFHTLCEWATSYVDLSPLARRRGEDAFVDVTACMIAGMKDVSTTSVIAAVEDFGPGSCLAFGASCKFSAPWAALINGTAAHALDFDDNFAPGITHASAVLVPALLSLASEGGICGTALVQAFVVGLELQGRIGRLMQPAHYQRGWHSTSTIGAIGTAGACARLLGGSPAQIVAAMSAATSMASGSKLQFGSMMKPIHAGLAAKNAVVAARFAMAGIRTSDDPLAGDWGFAALTGASDAGSDVMIAGLGETLEIETSGLLAKRFPCCGAGHRSIDALELLLNRKEFSLEEVDRIESILPEMAVRNLRFDHPVDEMQARFSGTYCMARMLVDGRLDLEHFTPNAIRDARIAGWLPRIRLIAYDDALMVDSANFAATTRVYLNDGRMLEATVSHPKGAPENPLGDDDLRAKFRTCCAWSGHAAAADMLFELAGSIGKAAEVSGVMGQVERALSIH